jgi:mannose-1-phosphate guanylyltransferase
MLRQAVILVGGQGTRLRPLTLSIPKPVLPVLNRPFLEHTVAYLKVYGIDHIVLAVSYLPEVVRGYLGDGSRLGVKLTYTTEESPLGTAGAVKNAERHLTETFAVLNGDIFTNLDLTAMFRFHQEKQARATLALTWVDNPSAFGVVETESNGRVRRFIEKPSPDKVTSHWINAGIYILEPEVLAYIPEGRHYMFEQGLFPGLLATGEPVYGYPYTGYWLDMGTPEKYLRLNHDLLTGRATSYLIPSPHQEVVAYPKDAVVHASACVTGPAIIGARSRIDSGATIRGPAVLGEGCHIGAGAELEEVVVWAGIGVEAGARLRRCVISYNREGNRVVNCITYEGKTR